MRVANYRWRLPNQGTQASWQPLVSKLNELKLPEHLAPFLWNRQIKDPALLESYFFPNVANLYDPFLFYDMEKAVERIRSAVENGEQVLIYGDYDADGITSTTVMKEALELIGANVEFYLPKRFQDGYGPNLNVFERFVAAGVSLIITVDNGVAGHEAIHFAKEHGVDVIVTDHHELPSELPQAFAILHPRHPLGNYPFGDLAGVGVAFKLATALLEEVSFELLDIVAIGTIADLVSLTDENRLLVQLGLKSLHQTERPGVQALCQIAGVKLTSLTEKDIGFTLAPRLNALGRLDDASPGVELLTSLDEEEAFTLAQKIQQVNEERQKIVAETTADALTLLPEATEHPIQIFAQTEWHEGVLGIVASRLVKETGRPALVLTIDRQTGIAKGSGRSVSALNLFTALNQHADLFTRFGGHHMAVGLTMPLENLPRLQEALDTYVAAENYELDKGEALQLDVELSTADLSIDYIASLNHLAPFGTDNARPIFLFSEAKVEQLKQVGAEDRHIKFQLVQDQTPLDVIGFQFGAEQADFSEAETIDAVGELDINEWNGLKKPQLLLLDYQVEGLQVFDKRSSHFPKDLLTLPITTLYVVFQQQHLNMIETIPDEQIFCYATATSTEKLLANWSAIVLVDCPVLPEQIKEVIQATKASRVYLCCCSAEQYYLTGLPNRQTFAKLFRFIAAYQNVDIKHKLGKVANFLKIEEATLKFMIQVFFDLNFVTIENGIMNKQTNVTQRQLNESSVYQEREQQIKTEEFLLFSDIQAIKKWLQ